MALKSSIPIPILGRHRAGAKADPEGHMRKTIQRRCSVVIAQKGYTSKCTWQHAIFDQELLHVEGVVGRRVVIVEETVACAAKNCTYLPDTFGSISSKFLV